MERSTLTTLTSSPSILLASGLTIGVLTTLITQHLLSGPPSSVPPSATTLDDGTSTLPHPTAGEHGEDIRANLAECVGNTPLVRINCLSDYAGVEILGKCEFLNPGGSIKDRVAVHLISSLTASSLLPPHSTLYEGTVGSTGLSLTTFSLALSHRTHIILPSDQSLEKINLLRTLGATVELVSPAPIVDQNHFVNLSRRRAAEHTAAYEAGVEGVEGKGYFVDQFENPENHHAHETSTGPEIFRQTGGRLSAFVAGAGTGGTLSGVARYLARQYDAAKRPRIVLADPPGSGLYNKVKHGVMFASTEREGTRRRHQVDTIVEGIGCNRLTQNFAAGLELVDDAERVSDEEAKLMAMLLVQREGIFVGSSSAVNCVAALRTAVKLKREAKEGERLRVVTILCDSGVRHLSKFWKTEEGVTERREVTVEDVLEAGERAWGKKI